MSSRVKFSKNSSRMQDTLDTFYNRQPTMLVLNTKTKINLCYFSKVLPLIFGWGTLGRGVPGVPGAGSPGPPGQGVKFRGVIKGHLWQIFKSLDLGQFLSKWALIWPKNCPLVWIIWIWSKNLGNNPWGSWSLQKVFLLLLNFALAGTPAFPNFWTSIHI